MIAVSIDIEWVYIEVTRSPG